jgi:hypothetical protein
MRQTDRQISERSTDVLVLIDKSQSLSTHSDQMEKDDVCGENRTCVQDENTCNFMKFGKVIICSHTFIYIYICYYKSPKVGKS